MKRADETLFFTNEWKVLENETLKLCNGTHLQEFENKVFNQIKLQKYRLMKRDPLF